MIEKCPYVPSQRLLMRMSGASAAFLLAGSAQGAVHLVTVGTTLTGDADGQFFAIRMTGGGNVSHQILASTAAFAALTGVPNTDAVFGIKAVYNTVASMFAISATGDHASVLRDSDFAALLIPSFGDINGLFLFRDTMRIATSIMAPYWQLGGILGIRFVPQGGTDAYYGFVWVTSMALDASWVTIGGYGWEDLPDIGIHPSVVGGGSSGTGGGSPAGGTPEPAASGLALLALGAAGVMRHRRRAAQTV